MTDATLIYRDTVTLTVPPMAAWILTVLLLMGIISGVHAALDWRDELLRGVKALWRRNRDGRANRE